MVNIPAILTLRYDPSRPAYRRRLVPEDFEPLFKKHDDIEYMIKDVCNKTLPDKLDEMTLTLSGGIDSHFTLKMFALFRPETKVHCITMGFNDQKDETKEAVELARKYDADCKVIVKQDILSDLEKIIPVVGEPRWNVYPYYIYEKCDTPVMYTSDGGDELWAGYTWRYSNLDYMATHRNDWLPDQNLLLCNWNQFDISPIMQYFQANTLHYVDQCLMADYNGKLLYDYIPQALAYGKHFGIDVRSLFLTQEMTYLATHTPWQLKYDGIHGKIPLQNILEIRTGAKRGFGPHLKTLWERQGRELYRYYIHQDSLIVRDSIINYEWVKKHPEPEDDRYINKMLQLVALEIWCRNRCEASSPELEGMEIRSD